MSGRVERAVGRSDAVGHPSSFVHTTCVPGVTVGPSGPNAKSRISMASDPPAGAVVVTVVPPARAPASLSLDVAAATIAATEATAVTTRGDEHRDPRPIHRRCIARPDPSLTTRRSRHL